jgi:hypothetical protein
MSKDSKGYGSNKKTASAFENALRSSAASKPKASKSKVTASSFEKAFRSAQKGKK